MYPDADRPDKIGLIVHSIDPAESDIQAAATVSKLLGYVAAVNVTEVWDGALDTEAAARLLKSLKRVGVFTLKRFKGCLTELRVRTGAAGVRYVTQERAKAKTR